MTAITSRRNPVVERYRASRDGPELLLEGPHLIGEGLEAGLRFHHAAITAGARTRPEAAPLTARLVSAGVELVTVSEPVMEAMSPVKSPWGIVALAARPSMDAARVLRRVPQLVIVAVDVQDPGNVGAMIRAAEAGGATGVLGTGATADPFGWRALRGSMGSALRVPIARCSTDEAVELIEGHGLALIATDPRGGRSLFTCDLEGPLAIAIGAEGFGLPASIVERASLRVSIPMAPPVESLNVAVSTALVVYEAFRQRHFSPTTSS
jgi:RNA methyltransferase, TrmH family